MFRNTDKGLFCAALRGTMYFGTSGTVLAMRRPKQSVVKIPERKHNSHLQPNKLPASTKVGMGVAMSQKVSPASS